MNAPLTAEVTDKREVATDVFAFRLAVDAARYRTADAGAHIDVHVPGGFLRQYSLTRPAIPGENAYEIAVLKEPDGRGGSLTLCTRIDRGDKIEISEPRNHFSLDAGQAHYILLGAGIGLTPILAMARTLHVRGASFELHACARSPDHVAFKADIDAAPWSGAIHYHFSDGDGANRLDLEEFLATVREDAQIYACGPARFLDGVDAATKGWRTGRVRQERFTASETTLSEADSGSFTIKIQSSGAQYEVAEDQTILDVLSANGISVEVSCTEGVCGTCLTGVLKGDLVHLDSCLYEEEQAGGNIMAVCISRGKPGTTVILDI